MKDTGKERRGSIKKLKGMESGSAPSWLGLMCFSEASAEELEPETETMETVSNECFGNRAVIV